MNKTKNYGLYLTDDDSTKFHDWRNRMDGTDDSNMMKIDAALGKKANVSITIDGTLSASKWIGEEAPYTQDFIDERIFSVQNGVIALSTIANSAEREEARKAIMSVTKQEDGVITISADGQCPQIDIPISLILYG